MTTGNNTELEVLKAQMNILKKHLAMDEIVSNEMVEATIKTKINSITHSRNSYLLGIALDFLMAAVFTIAYFTVGEISLGFIIVLDVWFMLWALIKYRNYKKNDRETLMSGSLTETAKNITVMRKTQSIHGLVGGIAIAIWLPAYFIEVWDGISVNPVSHISAALLIAFVIGSTIVTYIRKRRTSKEILEQIEEVTRES